MDYWEDRLAAAGKHEAAVKALEAFRRGRKTRDNEYKLYDKLVALGVRGEEADEIVNLEREEGVW